MRGDGRDGGQIIYSFMKVMIRSSDFILSEMGNHLNETDMMC